MIERKEYMNLLEKWRDKKAIKVVTGIRRCGKSSLLRQISVDSGSRASIHLIESITLAVKSLRLLASR